MAPEAYLFEAELLDFPDVRRLVAVAGDQTLVDLHTVLQEAFGWADDHLYSFWTSGRFWDGPETEYTAPVDLEPGQRSAAVAIRDLGLTPDQRIAYLFDFGDSWRVDLKLGATEPVEGPLPRVLRSDGEAPPQYEDADED